MWLLSWTIESRGGCQTNQDWLPPWYYKTCTACKWNRVHCVHSVFQEWLTINVFTFVPSLLLPDLRLGSSRKSIIHLSIQVVFVWRRIRQVSRLFFWAIHLTNRNNQLPFHQPNTLEESLNFPERKLHPSFYGKLKCFPKLRNICLIVKVFPPRRNPWYDFCDSRPPLGIGWISWFPDQNVSPEFRKWQTTNWNRYIPSQGKIMNIFDEKMFQKPNWLAWWY